MMLRNIRLAAISVLLCGLASTLGAQQPDLEDLREQAVKAAARKVGPSMVQIQTTGGTELVGSGPKGPQVRKGIGPTTGVILTADGYIASSAFNFANKPSSIDVAVPGHSSRYIAKVIATDTTRMITLLKIEATNLPVPVPSPKSQIKIGQTALALGRTLEADVNKPASVSEGIISATERIWGKALQTDAKVSPTNYGGPLVDLEGRVIGILIPADPRAEGETAGLEWYDSGIGFAVPLEDVNAVLPRLKAGTPEKPVSLDRGILGITPQSTDEYGQQPEVATVAPESAADKGGIKVGDVILEID